MSSSHKESVDINSMRNIMQNSHSEQIPNIAAYQSLTLINQNVQHFASFFESILLLPRQFLPPHQLLECWFHCKIQ
jgi:hypothetical protein